MDTNTVAQRLERARGEEILRTILREAVTRFNGALMDDEERMVVRSRIIRIRRRLGIMR